ncbi:hypothetical protein UPYG_G00122070 [Umbra pygmaea]|uniref:Spermatogenesis-associated protein 22 n=1 Tax=Umbra pygmaea TaxID=75934 RepID=A0ABD0X583_UMBPY
MRRYENQQARPTAGCLSVPLFNQKKRSRLPLTSNPSENECWSMFTHSSASSPNTSCNTGHVQDQASSCPALAAQRSQWNRQGIQQQIQLQAHSPSSRAQAPEGRSFTHQYKTGNTGAQVVQQQPAGRQDYGASTNSRQSVSNAPGSSGNAHGKLVPLSYYSQMGQQQQADYRQVQANPPEPPVYPRQSKLPPPPSRPSPGPTCKPSLGPGLQKQDTTWTFKSRTSSGSQKQLMKDSRHTHQSQHAFQPQMPPVFQVKPVAERSLRILTAVVSGMRHWSQFKDRALYLFEVFGTLDSAVTVGSHGAKNFLIRDGKDVIQCVFYENELTLPRLIRGQVHRCVGTFDCSRDTLTCMSVRAALPSEQRTSHESVKASDAEMRSLVKSLSEV